MVKYLLIFFCLFIFSKGEYAQGASGFPAIENQDEQLSSRKKVDPSGKNYLEIAKNYTNNGKFDLAKKYLDLASQSEDANIYEEVLIWDIYNDSLQGKKDLNNKLDQIMGDAYAKALYFAADGWQTYFNNNPEAEEIGNLSRDYRERLIAQFPDSNWADLSSIHLVPLFINDKEYDSALFYLLKYFEKMKSGNLSEGDRAWYYLAVIMEKSEEHKDLDKAIKAYQKVITYPDSMFAVQSRKKIIEIENLYFITR